MEFGEDGFGALRPDEGFRGLVVLGDEAVDGFLHARQCKAMSWPPA